MNKKKFAIDLRDFIECLNNFSEDDAKLLQSEDFSDEAASDLIEKYNLMKLFHSVH